MSQQKPTLPVLIVHVANTTMTMVKLKKRITLTMATYGRLELVLILRKKQKQIVHVLKKSGPLELVLILRKKQKQIVQVLTLVKFVLR